MEVVSARRAATVASCGYRSLPYTHTGHVGSWPALRSRLSVFGLRWDVSAQSRKLLMACAAQYTLPDLACSCVRLPVVPFKMATVLECAPRGRQS